MPFLDDTRWLCDDMAPTTTQADEQEDVKQCCKQGDDGQQVMPQAGELNGVAGVMVNNMGE